jgi:hypothetical protein
MFEAMERKGSLADGVVVSPIDRSFSMEAVSASAVEQILRENVIKRKLAGGRIYQICPGIGNPEPIRAVVIGEQANMRRVILDAAQGMYSVVRRVRYLGAETAKKELTTPLEVAA